MFSYCYSLSNFIPCLPIVFEFLSGQQKREGGMRGRHTLSVREGRPMHVLCQLRKHLLAQEKREERKRKKSLNRSLTTTDEKNGVLVRVIERCMYECM